MRKTFIAALIILVCGVIQPANAGAQQTPATNPAPASPAKAAQAPAAKAPQPPAAKSGQAPPAKSTTAPAAKSQSAQALKTQKEKVSYAIGLNIGKGMHRDSLDVDPNVLMQGLKDGLSDAKPLLTDDEMKQAITALQAEVNKKQEAAMQQAGEKNKAEGEAFLAANKSKAGVVTLPSGLQYKIIKQGTGAKPTAADSVVCNYRGTLIDGTEFDSSYKRGQPATFGVGQVIHGWTEALQLMPVGSKWQLFIPSEMAYGARGPSPVIGPNSTLVFEVELLSIQGKAQ